MGRLRIIFTEMTEDRARTDEQFREAVLQQEFLRETLLRDERFELQ